jgi:hypothetical protein
MAKKKYNIDTPLVSFYADAERFRMHQKGLFRWSLIGLALFLVSSNADVLAEVTGIEMPAQVDDPAHELFYLFPVLLLLMISIIIALCTGTLTLMYWSKLNSKPKKIITMCSAFGILLFAAYTGLRIILE